MGLFDRRKTSKGESRQNNVYSSVPYNVQINKYNSKQAVLDLIAYISTADNDFDAWNFFKDFYNNCAIPVDELDKMDNQNSQIEEEIEDIKKKDTRRHLRNN